MTSGRIMALVMVAAIPNILERCSSAGGGGPRGEKEKPAAAAAAPAKGPLPVQTAKASSFRASESIEASGTLSSDQDVVIMAAVTGNVTSVRAQEGDFVKKGKTLAIIDQADFKIGVAQAAHQLTNAQLALQQSQTDFERTRNLLESQSVPQAQFDGMKLKLDLAGNQVLMAKDALTMAKRYLQNSVVKAPFDCYVVNRLVSVGTRAVTMPPTALFRVVDLDHLTFKTAIPETSAKDVAEGDPVALSFESAGVDVAGAIDKVITSVDPLTMTFTATVKVDNAALGHALKPGAFGKIRIFSPSLKGTYVLDRSVVRAVPGKEGEAVVFVAAGGKAAARKVSIVAVDSLRVRVTAGLADGDELVTTGVAQLSDGAPIEAAQAGAAQ